MTDPVNHPAHYTEHPSGIECIQITEHMGFNLGNAVKYIWRADLKGSAIEDLEKARWYIDRELTKRDALFPATEPAEVNGNYCALCNSSPASAEPAEEETKAEALTTFLEGVLDYDSADMGWHLPGDWDPTDLADAIVHAPASSPVFPAPTETEWQTWQEVPEGVWFLTNQNIGCWMRRDGDKVTTVAGGWPVCTDSLVAQAPFVAAEEG